MGVAEDESALLEAAVGLSPAIGELDEVVEAGNEAGRVPGGSSDGLVSRPLSDFFPDVEAVAWVSLAFVGG
jgi:hypothetical protein